VGKIRTTADGCGGRPPRGRYRAFGPQTGRGSGNEGAASLARLLFYSKRAAGQSLRPCAYRVRMPARKEILDVDGREVSISNPDKVFFPRTGYTKLDLVRYYVSIGDGALRGVSGRPMALKRYVNGAEGEFFFQKRAPESRPDWVEVVELSFPSGRTAREIVVRDRAQLAWIVNLGCIDLNPHPVRADDLEHPDELRVDLDPIPGVPWSQVRDVAVVTREVLEDFGLVGWPKTSGSKGFHVYCRLERKWPFGDVRRAALALAREVERRAPDLATSKWWKEERHGVFLDYNQNAKDRTVASAYSVRPTPDARVSTPLSWDEVPDCQPERFTIATVPDRCAEVGDPSDGIDEAAGSLEALLELAAEHEAAGFGDAPWPPHYMKQADEPPRVQPSKRRMTERAGRDGTVPPPAPGKRAGPTGRRRTTMPLIEIARAATEAEALEGLDRWKSKHPDVWPHLGPSDVLVDAMRGRSTTWTRIRVNLRNVPENKRPPQERLEVDYDPWEGVEWPEGQERPRPATHGRKEERA
jgi:bifunctional non-homologous end joining protein LigD